MVSISLPEMKQFLRDHGYSTYLPQLTDFNEEEENICFACSARNPDGLQMEFFTHPDHEWVVTPFIIDQKYCGYPLYAHGGILTTLTDEVMSHVINFQKQCYAVTFELTMQFRKPVLINQPILVVGKLVEEHQTSSKTIYSVSGEIYSGLDLSFSSPVLVRGDAKWMKLSLAVLEKMKTS